MPLPKRKAASPTRAADGARDSKPSLMLLLPARPVS